LAEEPEEQDERTATHATSPASDPDVGLMLRFQAGDEAAFDALFDRWSGRLLRFLDRFVRDAATAEELLQETFLRVHRARDRYVPSARFSTWLYRIATNLAINERRRGRIRPVPLDDGDGSPLDPPSPEVGSDALVEARRLGGALVEALDELPPRQAQALWLAAVDGLSYAEIAGALDTSEGSVKVLVHRARAKLARTLSSGEELEDDG